MWSNSTYCSANGCCALLPAVCRATRVSGQHAQKISRFHVYSRDIFVPVALLGGGLLTCSATAPGRLPQGWETLTARTASEQHDWQADVQKPSSSCSQVADYDKSALGSGTNLA